MYNEIAFSNNTINSDTLTNKTEIKLNSVKIAILFSGRINDNLLQYNNILETLVQDYDVDFFISHSKTDNKELVNNFIKIYNPKKIMENDETCYFDYTKYVKNPYTNSFNTFCMFKNRNNVCKLFMEYVNETNTHYDILISNRCDLLFHENLNYLDLKEMIDNNVLCIPQGNDWYDGINDQFAIGNYNTITNYLQVYEELYNILESGIILHPETLLRFHLINKNIQIHRFSLNYNIQRYAT
jgi:hypothetical protein